MQLDDSMTRCAIASIPVVSLGQAFHVAVRFLFSASFPSLRLHLGHFLSFCRPSSLCPSMHARQFAIVSFFFSCCMIVAAVAFTRVTICTVNSFWFAFSHSTRTRWNNCAKMHQPHRNTFTLGFNKSFRNDRYVVFLSSACIRRYLWELSIPIHSLHRIWNAASTQLKIVRLVFFFSYSRICEFDYATN